MKSFLKSIGCCLSARSKLSVNIITFIVQSIFNGIFHSTKAPLNIFLNIFRLLHFWWIEILWFLQTISNTMHRSEALRCLLFLLQHGISLPKVLIFLFFQFQWILIRQYFVPASFRSHSLSPLILLVHGIFLPISKWNISSKSVS